MNVCDDAYVRSKRPNAIENFFKTILLELRMPQNYWHITRCPLFSQLSPETAQRIESRSRMKNVPKGETIYLPADLAEGVMVLVSGRVRICNVTHEGKQSILGFVEPGDLFGELAVLGEDSRNEHAEAVENCQVVLIPKPEMLWLMHQYPQISFGITKLIGLRRQRIERRLRNLLFRNNRERLILLLLELVELYGIAEDGVTHLRMKLSHQELANIIGSTRETVTVVLGKLQADGFLKVARRKIQILDLARLAEQVQEQPPRVLNQTPFIKKPTDDPRNGTSGIDRAKNLSLL